MSMLADAAVTRERADMKPGSYPNVPERLVGRIRAEFLEMPGLTLTLSQAARIFGLDARQSKLLLKELVDEGFLVRGARGTFRRLDASCS